jgi:inner membrane protein
MRLENGRVVSFIRGEHLAAARHPSRAERRLRLTGRRPPGPVGGMDSITQAALGAAVGEAMLGKKLGNRALLWGMLFGTLPDLDVLLSPFFDTARNLAMHRGASHSLLLMVIASFALAPWLAKRWKKNKVSKGLAGAFVFAVWSTHVLLDCFTVYGTSVLWPFSDSRIAFNNLFIIDPLYTLPLIITLVWLAFLRTKQTLPKRRRLCWWGLGLSTGYVALSLLAKWTVSNGFDADLQRRGAKFTRRMEAPTPLNILFWRSVVDRGDEFWVGYRSIFEFSDTPVRWTVYPKGEEVFFPMAEMRETKTIAWFSNGWWIARSHANGLWLGDLRFGESRTYGERKGMVDARLAFSWIFNATADGDRLRQPPYEWGDTRDNLKRMMQRIFGNRDAWEATPRLAGIHGRLPESLRVEE